MELSLAESRVAAVTVTLSCTCPHSVETTYLLSLREYRWHLSPSTCAVAVVLHYVGYRQLSTSPSLFYECFILAYTNKYDSLQWIFIKLSKGDHLKVSTSGLIRVQFDF